MSLKLISDSDNHNTLTLSEPTTQNGHTQTICPMLPTNYLSVFDHFVGVALKGLTKKKGSLWIESNGLEQCPGSIFIDLQ